MAAGRYRERPPVPALRPVFRRVWVHRIGAAVDGTAGPVPVRVVPDGCIDLLWIDGALCVAGPDRTAFLEALRPGALVAGLRFRAAAAAPWLGVPASELTGRRVPLADLWAPGPVRDLARHLADGDDAALAGRLEAAVAALAPRPAADPAMRAVFRRLARGGIAISDLAGTLDLNERTLRRRCRDAFGYGPKTLDGILRFRRALPLIRRGELAAAALRAGYADQAHMSREVRRLAGVPPGRLARELAG